MKRGVQSTEPQPVWVAGLWPPGTLLLTIRHPAVRSAIWLFLEKLLRFAVGLLLTVWIARYLGPIKYGELSLLLSFVVLFVAFAGLGIDSILLRELVRHPDAWAVFLGSALVLRIVGTVFVVLLATASASFFDYGVPELRLLVFVASLATCFQLSGVIDLYFQSRKQFVTPILVRAAAFLAGSSIRALLAVLDAPLISFAWVGGMEAAIGAIGLLIVWRRKSTGERLRPEWSTMRYLAGQGLPILLAGVAVACYARIDVLMLSAISGNEMVGIYGAATAISESFYLIPVVLLTVLAPSFAEWRTRSHAVFYARLHQFMKLMAILGIIIAIGTSLVATPVVQFLYGSAYRDGGLMLAVHVWSTLFVFISVASEPWFINNGYQWLYVFKTFLAAAINVVLNLAWIPEYGGIGAAVATLVSYSVSAYWSNLLLPKARILFRLQTSALTMGLFPFHVDQTRGGRDEHTG